jgi:hypothetical protein
MARSRHSVPKSSVRETVGLAVHLDQHADAVVVHVRLDAALRHDPVRPLAFAMPDLRSASIAVEVSAGLGSAFLRHHARPGHVPGCLTWSAIVMKFPAR